MSQAMNEADPKASVGIIMGSDSDLPVMQAAADILTEMGIAYEMTIVSAHRTPARLFEYSQNAAGRGLKVIIAGAGGAAHLPGMVAAISPLPIIGVPVKTSALGGQDSLLSIVQMPGGGRSRRWRLMAPGMQVFWRRRFLVHQTRRYSRRWLILR